MLQGILSIKLIMPCHDADSCDIPSLNKGTLQPIKPDNGTAAISALGETTCDITNHMLYIHWGLVCVQASVHPTVTAMGGAKCNTA